MKTAKKIFKKNRSILSRLIAKIQITQLKLFFTKTNKTAKVKKDFKSFLKQDLKNGMNAKNVSMIKNKLFHKNVWIFQYQMT